MYSLALMLTVVMSLLNMVSSAYSLTDLDGNTLPISFKYNKKSNGPRTEPCGTPQVILIGKELLFWTDTYSCLSAR